MSLLIEAQDAFFDALSELKRRVREAHPRWRLTLAEVGVQARRRVVRDGKVFEAIDKVHRTRSLHYERLAADINLFVKEEDGKLRAITRSDAPEWAKLHAIWLSIDPLCKAMPSSSSDANHLSRPLPNDPRI